MKSYETTSFMTLTYKGKRLINKDNFSLCVGGYCLAFHRRAQSARLNVNVILNEREGSLKDSSGTPLRMTMINHTLTDMHGA